MKRLPNVFIPGAQKAGSSSLCYYLKEHPECSLSNPKETHFFSKSHRLEEFKQYESFFLNANSKIIIDGSTSYLYNSSIPRKIREKLGSNLKFIIIIRDPVERAISAYYQAYKKFHDKRNIGEVFSFKGTSKKQIIKEEDLKLNIAIKKKKINFEYSKKKHDFSTWQFYYVKNGFYYSYIKEYVNIFSRERVKVVLFEELRDNPQKVLREIFTFLGVKKNFNVSNIEEKYNKTKIPSSNFLFKIGFKVVPLIPIPIRRYLSKLNLNFLYSDKKDLDTELKNKLYKIYDSEKKYLMEYNNLVEKYWN